LLSKFLFVLHIHHAALPKLFLRFRLKRSAFPQRYKNFVTLHPSKQKLHVKKFGLTAHILSSAAYSDTPLSRHTKSDSPLRQHTYSESPLRRHAYSDSPLSHHTKSDSPLRQHTYSESPLRRHAYSDSPLPVALPTQDDPLPFTLPTQLVHFAPLYYSEIHFPSPYLLRHFTSCHLAYSDSPLPVAIPTSLPKRYLYPTSSPSSPAGRTGNIWKFRSRTHLVFPPYNICSGLTNSPTSFITLSLVQSSEA
jgi:hypothetical protein